MNQYLQDNLLAYLYAHTDVIEAYARGRVLHVLIHAVGALEPEWHTITNYYQAKAVLYGTDTK
jgi:hypothetical protein